MPSEPVDGLKAPDRIVVYGRLAASDPVVSADLPHGTLWEDIESRLAPRLGSRLEPIADLLRPLFDSGGLRPLVSAMSRGAQWRASILQWGREIGVVALDAVAVGNTFVAKEHLTIEFEAGAESQTSEGAFREGRWRLFGGIYVKGDPHDNQYRGAPNGYRDSLSLDQFEDSGRFIAKTKTVEAGVIFKGLMEVGVEVMFFGETIPEVQATHDNQVVRKVAPSIRHPIDVEITVGVPRADCRDADGNPPKVEDHYAPPPRITKFQRFGSTDTIWDLHLLPRGPVAHDSSPRLLRQATPEWMGEIEQAGAAVFGASWPRVAGEVAAQLQPGVVHQRLREMGSGQPIEVHSLPSTASVEVIARVIRLEHVRGTQQTEFAAGTEVRRRIYGQEIVTRAATAPPGQDLAELPHAVEMSGAVTESAGRDHMLAHAEDSRTGVQTKAKVLGEVFDGVVELHFNLRYAPPLESAVAGSHEAVATAHVAVRVVIERDECVKVGRHDETVWDADPAGASEAPRTETDLRSSHGVMAGVGIEKAGLTLPAEEMWSGGLRDTSVILDLWGIDRLRQELRHHLAGVVPRLHRKAIESTVLSAYGQNRLMAHLAAMTRGVPLESSDIPHLGAGDFKIAATANVTALMFRRRVPKAELAPQGDVGSQLSDRRFGWWTAQLQAQLGERPSSAATQLVLPTGGGQFRHRTGWRMAAGGQAVANAKFNVPLVYFTGLVRLSFTASRGTRRVRFDVTLPFEVGLPAGLTRTLRPTGRTAPTDEFWPTTEDEYRALTRKAPDDIAPASGYLVGKPEQSRKFALPERVENGRLSRSDFVLSIHPDTNQLAEQVTRVLKPLGSGAARQVRKRLGTAAVKPRIPGMTNGDVIKVTVSGNGWLGYVSVTASIGEMAYRESAPKVEFENGTENYTTLGLSLEGRHRRIFGLQYIGKFPHSSLSISGNAYQETTEGLVSDVTGREIAKGKTLEAGALLDGEIQFHINYRLRRAGRAFSLPSDARTVSIPALVMVPERDMRTIPEADGANESFAGVQQPQVLAKWFAVPERTRRSLALSSSDIVLDVWPNQQPGQPSWGMTDMLRDPGLDQRGRSVFGRSWPAMLEKILDEVDLQRLQFELKSMMAGHPITVHAPAGKVGRILITARLASARHVGSTAQTEFNIGTARVHDRAAADPRVTSSASNSVNASVQVLGSSDPTGHVAGAQAGPTFVGYIGTNDYEFLGVRTTTGMTTKVKTPGAVYDGKVGLQIRLENKRWLRAARVRLHRRAQVNVRFLAEQDPSERVDSAEKTVFDGNPLRCKERPVPGEAESAAPPRRVWGLERGQGLRDTDTIRGLPDTGGLLQALDVEGKAVFGAGAWHKLAPVMRGALSHATLAAGLPAMTRGETVLNPLSFPELGRSKGRITVKARVVRMEYLRKSEDAEKNPVNEFTAQSSRSEQYWWQGGLQVQAGAEIGPVTVAGMLGVLYRHRKAALLNSTGRVIANAKFPEPTAIYDAHILTIIALSQGDKKRVITGIIAAEIGIPLTDTKTLSDEEKANKREEVTEFHPPPLHEEPEELAQLHKGPEESPAPALPAPRGLTAEEERALLGAGHGLSTQALARAWGLADRLRAADERYARASTAEYLRRLSVAVGLHHQDAPLVRWTRQMAGTVDMPQLFELLDLAAQVFTAEPPTIADVTNLRRLGDMIALEPLRAARPRHGHPLTINSLRAEFRRQRLLSADAEVTDANVRELVEVMRIAKHVRIAEGGGRVRREDLKALREISIWAMRKRQEAATAPAYPSGSADGNPAWHPPTGELGTDLAGGDLLSPASQALHGRLRTVTEEKESPALSQLRLDRPTAADSIGSAAVDESAREAGEEPTPSFALRAGGPDFLGRTSHQLEPLPDFRGMGAIPVAELSREERAEPGNGMASTAQIGRVDLAELLSSEEIEALVAPEGTADLDAIKAMAEKIAGKLRDAHQGMTPPANVPLTIAVPASAAMMTLATRLAAEMVARLDHSVLVEIGNLPGFRVCV